MKPLESRSALWKQTLDECTYLLLVYNLMCFTNFVSSPEDRNQIGYAYLLVMNGNIGIHMIVLILSTIFNIKLRLKRCCLRRHLYHCWCFCKKTIRSNASL